MKILSINFNHDGAGVVLDNGRITGYVNTERFSRIKKHPGMRDEDLTELLEQAKISLEQIDLAILCNLGTMDSPDIPQVYGTNLKETWFPFTVSDDETTVLMRGVELPCLLNPDHYLLHCSLAWYTSPFDSGISFCWDPTGYGAYAGNGNKVTRLRLPLPFNASEVYDLASQYLFGTGLFGAGKVMGLAPYGRGIEIDPARFDELSDPQKLLAFSQQHPVTMQEGKLSLNARIAYNVQWLMQEQLCRILDNLYEQSKTLGAAANICLSGGGALNSVANQLAFERSRFDDIFMHPACGDDGTAIGAALWYWHHELNQPRHRYDNPSRMYSLKKYEDRIDGVVRAHESSGGITAERTDAYIRRTAELVAAGKVIGWYQGSSEMGPRALGNRSIVADPRRTWMKDKLNLEIKMREGFRPFAPSVLNEHAQEWFGLHDSPFMLRVCDVLEEGVPAITHEDRSARIQTVSREDNPAYYQLIQSFYEITGVPLVVNTSFNTRSEPVVESPQDAMRSFLQSRLDHLVFPGIVVSKNGDAVQNA